MSDDGWMDVPAPSAYPTQAVPAAADDGWMDVPSPVATTPSQVPAQPGIGSRIWSDWGNRTQQFESAQPETKGLDQLAAILGGIGDVGREAFTSLMNTPGGRMIKGTGELAAHAVSPLIENSPAGTAIKEGATEVGEAANKWAQSHPEGARIISDYGDILGGAGALSGVAGMGESALESTGAKSIGDIIKDLKPEIKYPNSDIQRSLFRTDVDAATHSGELYNWRDKMAAGKAWNPVNTRSTLDDLIGEAKSTVPNPDDDPVIRKLSNIRESIGDSGKVPLQTLTDLDRTYNALYNRPSLSGSSILGEARQATKTDLAAAGEAHPEFGDANAAANQFHSIWKHQFDNDTMGAVYAPEDTRNLSLYYNGKVPSPHADTLTNAQNMMGNIEKGGVARYQQVLSNLPEEDKSAFENQFKDYLKQKYGNGWFSPFKSVKSNIVSFFKNGEGYGANAKAILKSQKGKMPFDYGAEPFSFDKFIDQSKNRLQEMQDFQASGGYGKSYLPTNQLAAPSPRLALPAPETPFAGGSGAAPERMSPEAAAAAETARQQGLSPDVRRANMQRNIGDIAGRTPLLGYNPESTKTFQNAPTEEMRGNVSGALQPTTNLQKAQADALRQHLYGMGYTPDVIRAQMARRGLPLGLEQQIRGFAKSMGVEPKGKSILQVSEELDNALSDTDIPPFLRNMPQKRARGGAVNTQPTEKQIAAGNYRKGHVKLHGLDISIETPKGSERSGTDHKGKAWSVTMPHHYGYIKGSIGADGQHVDCFLGDDHKSQRIYVIDQKKHDNSFDEHKCMLCFKDRDAAVKAYKDSFSDRKNRIMKVTRFTIPEFREWLKKGNTKKPVGKAA